MPLALNTNRLVTSPQYPKILEIYNSRLREQGLKMSDRKFYLEVVAPLLPGYSISAWYQFLQRFKTDKGLTEIAVIGRPKPPAQSDARIAEGEVAQTMLTNQQATTQMIANILNISAAAAKEIMEDPTKISPEKRVELGLKMMKAQDSRVKAIGAMRADNREQERFEQSMNSAAYG